MGLDELGALGGEDLSLEGGLVQDDLCGVYRNVQGCQGCQGVSGVSGNARGVREVHGDARACKGVQGAACIPWFYRV